MPHSIDAEQAVLGALMLDNDRWDDVVTLIRVTFLVLSIPLFLMAVLVAVVDGLGRRDLRRYGAACESSFVYHHAKRFVRPAFYVPYMVYLSWPSAVYPNLLMLPAALMLGIALAVLTASFILIEQSQHGDRSI
ncbi:TIGR03747 family integrating conjugative element membrane protein [Pantoea nemavictus]|uniref:TIGR03747 family integrating conjugative element membrane protein n=1 Tax=Pantoea nemavictus TaxID=2726955 RepID=UPI003BB6793A